MKVGRAESLKKCAFEHIKNPFEITKSSNKIMLTK